MLGSHARTHNTQSEIFAIGLLGLRPVHICVIRMQIVLLIETKQLFCNCNGIPASPRLIYYVMVSGFVQLLALYVYKGLPLLLLRISDNFLCLSMSVMHVCCFLTPEDVFPRTFWTVINTLRTGILNCLNARSRGLNFRYRASCIQGQAFRYSPENAFYIFNQQIYFII